MENAIFFDYNSIFSSRLRSLIEENHISKQKLADEIGVSRQAISQYCDGSTVPNADKLLKIAEYFNVSLDFLVGKTEAKTDNKDVQFICDYTGLNESSVDILHYFVHILSKYPEDLALTNEQYEEDISYLEDTLNFYNYLITSDKSSELTSHLSSYLLTTRKLIDELKDAIKEDLLSDVEKCYEIIYDIEYQKTNLITFDYYQALDYMKKTIDEFCTPTVSVLEELEEKAKNMLHECNDINFDFLRFNIKNLIRGRNNKQFDSLRKRYFEYLEEVNANADNNEA